MLHAINKWIWYWLFVLLNWIDYDTTRIMVERTDSQSEANLFVRWMIDNAGMDSVLWWKVCMVAILAGLIRHISTEVFMLLSSIFLIVVFMNIYYVLGGL